MLDREQAPIGVFLTLEPPTRPMETEAASAGFYMLGGRQYPRVQIITVEQALRGAKPAIPLVDAGAAFKRAPREAGKTQGSLLGRRRAQTPCKTPHRRRSTRTPSDGHAPAKGGTGPCSRPAALLWL